MAVVNQTIEQQKKNQQNAAAQQAQQTQQQVQAVQPAQQQQQTAVQPAAQAQSNLQQQATQLNGNTYNSKYGEQLNNILQQIQNPQQFKYDFNGDELFKYYADLYTQNGKQASMDAMGQAAALTGGYGNSYAQQVGNQAYNEYLRNLYDKGFDLRNIAYQQYQDEQQGLKDQYNILANQDQTDYNRWAADREYEEAVRQFNENLNWEKMNSQQKYAYETAMMILQKGQMPSTQLLQQAGLSAADAKKLQAQIKTGGGSGRTSGQDYYYLNGKYYQTNKNGKMSEVDQSKIDFNNNNNYYRNADEAIVDAIKDYVRKGSQGTITDLVKEKIKNGNF
jgi:hypothetical protein